LKILRNISFFAALSILTSVVSFLLLPIMTKYLTAKDYGILSIFNALVNFMVATISLGSLNVIMVSLVDKKNDFFNLQFRAFFQISLNNALIFSLLISIYILFVGDFFGLPSWLAFLTPIIALSITTFDAVVSISVYKKQYKEYALLTMSKFFIEILLSIFFIVSIGLNWIGRINGLLLGLGISLILSYNFLKKQNHLNLKLNKKIFKDLIRTGSPLILMNLSIIVMNLSDRFFIEKMVGINDTGFYNVGAIIGGIELIIANAAIAVFRPLIYKNLKEGKRNYKIQILNLLLLTGTFIGIYLLNDLIFSLFINKSFHESQQYVLPISLGFLFWGICNFYISDLIYYKKNRFNAYISIFGMVINLLLNYTLIQKYSTIGAAYATTLTYLLMSIAIYIIYLKVTKENAKTI